MSQKKRGYNDVFTSPWCVCVCVYHSEPEHTQDSYIAFSLSQCMRLQRVSVQYNMFYWCLLPCRLDLFLSPCVWCVCPSACVCIYTVMQFLHISVISTGREPVIFIAHNECAHTQRTQYLTYKCITQPIFQYVYVGACLHRRAQWSALHAHTHTIRVYCVEKIPQPPSGLKRWREICEKRKKETAGKIWQTKFVTAG